MPEHCVQLIVKLSDENFGKGDERTGMYEIEDALELALEESDAGEYDGHEFGGGKCVFYMYGENADELFNALRDTLEMLKQTLAGRARVVRRYGPPEEGVREETAEL
jgi:hypothetical protein